MTNERHAREWARKSRNVVEGGEDVVTRTRPASTPSDPPVFDVPGGETGLGEINGNLLGRVAREFVTP